MTQALPTVAQLFGIDPSALERLQESLSQDDRQALEALFNSLKTYNLAAEQAAHTLPIELFLLTLLMEHHKVLQFLIGRRDYYDQKLYARQVKAHSETKLPSV